MYQKKQLPDQRSDETLDGYIKRTWAADAGLRSEFSDLETYAAFTRAEAAGLVRIINKEKNDGTHA